MQFILLIFLALWSYDNTCKKIAKKDANPTCTVKSDKWKREHGQL
jgi:hypothetical protein